VGNPADATWIWSFSNRWRTKEETNPARRCGPAGIRLIGSVHLEGNLQNLSDATRQIWDERMVGVRTAIGVVGKIVYWVFGLLLFLFWMVAMVHWFGVGGIILGLIFIPGFIIFPIVYWVVEGSFPLLYFVLWAVSLLGIVAAVLASEQEDHSYSSGY